MAIRSSQATIGLAYLAAPVVGLLGTFGGNVLGAEEDHERQFIGVIVKDTEVYWQGWFQSHGLTYIDPKVVLYSGQTDSACGTVDSSAGPTYCPSDQRVYVDPAQLEQVGAKFGDFAQAFVIAREIGHHVQRLRGGAASEQPHSDSEAFSVESELQADCYAGAWSKGELELGYLDDSEVRGALDAVSSIADAAVRDQWSSSLADTASGERVDWFVRGYDSDDPDSCGSP